MTRHRGMGGMESARGDERFIGDPHMKEQSGYHAENASEIEINTIKEVVAMKRSRYIIVSALVLTLAMLSAAWAAETKEEKNLQRESAAINATAGTTKGATVVTQRLEKEFNVTGTQIQSLRDQKLGYGEIAIVFSLAQKMTGGITDANIQSVMTLREGPPVMGWGEIAKKLGTKLGPAISQVRNVNRDTVREMKHESMGGKGQMERYNEQHEEMTGHGGMDNGQGMSHGRDR